MFLCVLWPKENIFKGKPYSNLLSFSQIKEHLPWNVILFAGGCLSLSEGFQLSGLSDKIGNIFNQIAPKDQFQALVLVICFASIVTEVSMYFSFFK
jgi:di/tricarboxylate transporter